jgi:hypothetical protein
MKRQINVASAILLLLFPFFGSAVDAGDTDKRVSAKIGIMIRSGDEVNAATSRDLAKPGDRIRIFVHPENQAYIYVVHTDGKNARLLNITMQKFQGATLCLPSIQAYYQIDGKAQSEKFTVICSPDELDQLSGMTDQDMPHGNWEAVEAKLSEQSKALSTRGEDTSVKIAGNVRGSTHSSEKDLFVEKLPFYSGRGLLVKTYEFKLEK